MKTNISCLLWPLATLFVEDKTVSKKIKDEPIDNYKSQQLAALKTV
jgi:hypothetical protein